MDLLINECEKDDNESNDKTVDTTDLRGTTDLKGAMTGPELTKASTVTDKQQSHTLENAIWKENTKDFLIVSDDFLSMPDCTLRIRSLSDREIEINVDPGKQLQ